jgi:hypothetical protein
MRFQKGIAMKTKPLIIFATTLIFCAGLLLPAFSQELKPLQLPEPKLDPGKSLVQALKERKTTRDYAADTPSEQTLANLLWACVGINRPDSGRRTAPTALNWQEIDVYIALPQGMFLYDAKANVLNPVVSGDIRSLTYTQPVFKDAPVNLVYVADLEKMGDGEEAVKMGLAAMDTGFASQNVYLYCASEGLNTGFRVTLDKGKLAQALKLRPTQRIMGAQSVGLRKGK